MTKTKLSEEKFKVTNNHAIFTECQFVFCVHYDELPA